MKQELTLQFWCSGVCKGFFSSNPICSLYYHGNSTGTQWCHVRDTTAHNLCCCVLSRKTSRDVILLLMEEWVSFIGFLRSHVLDLFVNPSFALIASCTSVVGWLRVVAMWCNWTVVVLDLSTSSLVSTRSSTWRQVLDVVNSCYWYCRWVSYLEP